MISTPPSSPLAEDVVFFESPGVRVSRTRFTVSGADYALATLTSVRVVAVQRLMPAGAVLMLMGIVAFTAGSGSPVWMLAGLAIGGVGFGLLFVTTPAQLFVQTAGREVQAVTGKQAEIDAIAKAVRQAMDARG